MHDALAEAWMINHRATLLLLNHLDAAALQATLSTRGGRSVGQQFVHVVDVRRWKLEEIDQTWPARLPPLTREQGHDPAALSAGLTATAGAIETVIRATPADGHVKGFKRGLVALVTYLIAHDAHHRGHALLTLKQCGVRVPADVRMAIWAWNAL